MEIRTEKGTTEGPVCVANPCYFLPYNPEDPTVLKVLVLMEDDLWSLEQAPIGRSHVTKTMQSTEENYTFFAK